MRRPPLMNAVLLLAVLLPLTLWSPVQAAAPADGTTTVFAKFPSPGFPAYVHAHTNGRVYAGSYVHTGDSAPSKVFEWSSAGKLLRSWTVPGQALDEDHGVQVANQTADGKLVLLETSTRSVLTLDIGTGRFRRAAQLPSGATPNYATWGPGALYVTDYTQGIVWRLARGHLQKWFSSPALSGVEFGTTGIRYRPSTHDLLITQGSTTDGASLPTNGHLYRLPITSSGAPGALRTLWTSRPGDLPDGFGIGRSGHVYVALAGLANQVVELDSAGVEVHRYGSALTGDNGSSVPYDTPCSATFLGSRILVANQSAVAGDASHQAILSTYVGEPGVAPYLPRDARL